MSVLKSGVKRHYWFTSVRFLCESNIFSYFWSVCFCYQQKYLKEILKNPLKTHFSWKTYCLQQLHSDGTSRKFTQTNIQHNFSDSCSTAQMLTTEIMRKFWENGELGMLIMNALQMLGWVGIWINLNMHFKEYSIYVSLSYKYLIRTMLNMDLLRKAGWTWNYKSLF